MIKMEINEINKYVCTVSWFLSGNIGAAGEPVHSPKTEALFHFTASEVINLEL